MVPTRWGTQPSWTFCKQNGVNVSELAAKIGVTYAHLVSAITGRVRPNDRVREQLPKALGVPLERLFTTEVLSQPYYAGRGPHPRQHISRRSV